MPKGIILSSGSVGAKPEDVERVLEAHGYEAEKPEVETPAEPVEPKREDFKTDEEFEAAQETFETAQEEAEEKAEQEKEAAEQQRRPSRRQRAIDKATKELKEENRKLAERLKALEDGKGPAKQPEAVKEPEKPKREDFKSDDEFDNALFDWRYKVRRAKEAQEEAKNALEAQLKANFENYKTQVAAFKEEHDDWDKVVNQAIPIHESVYLAICEQENGAAVTYYLGKHPDYARKLADMLPLSAVMEVGRLAERLKTGAPKPGEADRGAPRKPKPNLPEPVAPVSTAATSSTVTSAEAAKNRDFKAFKAAQRARK